MAVAALVSALACGGPSPPPSPPPTRPLVIAMGADLATLDPHVAFDDVSSHVLGNLFEALVGFDDGLRLVPQLALRWINPDDRTWRFFLDPHARFPDGSPLRAADVKFSVERLREVSGSQLSGFVSHVKQVVVVDDLTVDLHTDSPVAILNGLALIPIVSERHVKAVGPERVALLPFGTGPYKLVRWDRGRVLVLEANEHRREQPAVRRVEFRLQPDGQRLLEDVLRDRPDLTLYMRRGLLEEFERRRPPALSTKVADGLAVYSLALNLGRARGPLADIRVRLAIAHAVDREELASGRLRGLKPAEQLVVAPVFGYDPAYRAPAHDPGRARALLREAGATGTEIVLTSSEGGTHLLEKTLLAQLERAGFKTRLDLHPEPAFTEGLEAGAYMATVQGYGCTSGDAAELLAYGLKSRGPGGQGAGNYAWYANPAVDELADQNLRVFDARARLAMLRRALRLAADDLPYIPLVSVQDVYVVSEAVAWTPPVSGEVKLARLRFR